MRSAWLSRINNRIIVYQHIFGAAVANEAKFSFFVKAKSGAAYIYDNKVVHIKI